MATDGEPSKPSSLAIGACVLWYSPAVVCPYPTHDEKDQVTARQDDTDRFYALLHDLSDRVGGPRKLSDASLQRWPAQGVRTASSGSTRTP
jgi:hypothetical protein